MQDKVLKLANELDAGDNFYAESSLYYDTNLSNAVSESAALLRTQHAAIERKDALLRKLIAALDSDRHDIDDWPPESCEAVYDIRQELSQ